MNIIVVTLIAVFVLAGAAVTYAVDKDIEVQGAGHMAGITLKLPTQWDFKTDAADAGINEKWFSQPVDDRWQKIDITRVWTVQPPGKDYRGIAWCHVNFTLPADVDPGHEHFVYFHALDGFADVYFDGHKVGQKKDNQDTWGEAFCIPLPTDLDAAAEHHLVVRVDGNKSRYTPGIWRPVFIVPPLKTILFTDFRHIQCSDLRWVHPDGHDLPLNSPPPPAVDAVAIDGGPYRHFGMVPTGIRLEAQPGNKTERRIEGRVGRRIVYDNGKYRSFFNDGFKPLQIVCTESTDGYEWKEVSRDKIDFHGNYSQGNFFFIDTGAPPDQRYKFYISASVPPDQIAGEWDWYQHNVGPEFQQYYLRATIGLCLYAFVSADGYEWKLIDKPIMQHMHDSDPSIHYDEFAEKYVMYTRLPRNGRRTIGRAETTDFFNWGAVKPMIYPRLDAPTDDFYLNAYSTYPGLPRYHLMFPLIYHRYDQDGEIRLYSSEDGYAWNEVPGPAVITDDGFGEPYGEFVWAHGALVPWGDDRVALLFGGTPNPHKYPRWPIGDSGMSWVWWPKGRLSAVVADQRGEFFTPPIMPAGKKLTLNVHTKRAGYVQVGLVGVPGRSVDDCDRIFGDHAAATVTWKGESDINTPVGWPVYVHIKMRSAKLFALGWE